MENGKLTALTAGVVLAGVSSLMDTAQARVQSAPAFAVRESGPSRPPVIPLPVGERPPSPLPFAGTGFSDDPMETLGSTQVLPPERPFDDESARDAVASRQSFRALTSFDEKSELTSGSASRTASSVRTFPSSPAQWNNPIQWLSTHER